MMNTQLWGLLAAVTAVSGLLMLPSAEAAEPVSIDGTVWADTNGNGLRDPGEGGLPGVAIGVLKPNGALADSGETDAEGRYLFDGLPVDTYAVEIMLPRDKTLVRPDSGADGKDSDLDWYTHRSEPVKCTGGSCGTVDAGLAERKANLTVAAEPREVTVPPGGQAEFHAVLRNTGNVPAGSVGILVPYTEAIDPAPTGDGWACIASRPGYLCRPKAPGLDPGASTGTLTVPVVGADGLPDVVRVEGTGLRDETNTGDNSAGVTVNPG